LENIGTEITENRRFDRPGWFDDSFQGIPANKPIRINIILLEIMSHFCC